MCIRISILSLLYDIVKSELDLLFVAPLSAGVKQRNSGLDAWASTQLQAADLGTASRLRSIYIYIFQAVNWIQLVQGNI